jgi:hypothetical protein
MYQPWARVVALYQGRYPPEGQQSHIKGKDLLLPNCNTVVHWKVFAESEATHSRGR